MTVLITYSTTDGQTLRIAEYLREYLQDEQQFAVTLLPVSAVEAVQVKEYAGIILGASIRYGKHKPEVAAFVHRHAALLAQKPSAFYSVNAVARKAEKRTPQGNVYVRKFLASIPWQPRVLGIFGGRIHYALYKPWDRFMIRLIMHITKGPTAADTNIEYTDWQDVRTFGEKFGQALRGESVNR